ncbi:hypothetical protein NHX12_003059 [Muraenolepis orangiensis]|uniref:Uncharacterized protein n=1 Tax=Muraenolepis orangiensis TaxID=630683 RepID=A0A9Q0DXB4_9TELE|nr:hypothetical protein NHX12_003059 [Muraenolepis orangiensis]
MRKRRRPTQVRICPGSHVSRPTPSKSHGIPLHHLNLLHLQQCAPELNRSSSSLFIILFIYTSPPIVSYHPSSPTRMHTCTYTPTGSVYSLPMERGVGTRPHWRNPSGEGPDGVAVEVGSLRGRWVV